MSYPPPPPPGQPEPQPYPGAGGNPEYWQESPKSKGMAVAALVCGILAVLTFCTIVGGILFGLVAVVLGIIATVKARRGAAGGGVMAVIGLVLGVGAIIAAIVFGLVFWGFWEDIGGEDFRQCVSNANNDSAAIAACEDQFNERLEDKFGVTMEPEPAN